MGWKHLRDETPTAAKPHGCYLCGREIGAGERHIKRSGITDDGPFAFRMHVACELKAHNWDKYSWEVHDQAEFREHELQETNET